MSRKRFLYTSQHDPDDFLYQRRNTIGCYRLGHGWTDGRDAVTHDNHLPVVDIPQSAFDAMPPRKNDEATIKAEDTLHRAALLSWSVHPSKYPSIRELVEQAKADRFNWNMPYW